MSSGATPNSGGVGGGPEPSLPAVPRMFPVSDALRRRSVLAVLDVARLRRFSALAWVATWVVFLVVLALGAANLSSFDSIAFIFLSLGVALLLPGATSIFIGFFSSLRWGEEFRNLIGNTEHLTLAWLPGIRRSKRAWNLSRAFLWASWLTGVGAIVTFYTVPYLFVEVYSGTSVGPGPPPISGWDIVVLTPLVAFVFFRILHHYFFAQSVTSAHEALVEDGPTSSGRSLRDWWPYGAVALPFDPIIVVLIVILSELVTQGPVIDSPAYQSVALTAVVAAGAVSMTAAAVLSAGYWQVERSARGWLARSRNGGRGPVDSVPPEWLHG